jgi:hypothetical protein
MQNEEWRNYLDVQRVHVNGSIGLLRAFKI